MYHYELLLNDELDSQDLSVLVDYSRELECLCFVKWT